MSMASSRAAPGAALVLLALAVVLLVRGCDDGGRRAAARRPSARRTRRSAEVVRVVDGDTIEVRLDGSEEDVRYIGIDTPETVDARHSRSSASGHEASARSTTGLVEGERGALVFDAERRDDYGRLLAYVYVRRRALVNATLVRAGLRAHADDRAEHSPGAARFARLQASRAGRARPVGRLSSTMRRSRR